MRDCGSLWAVSNGLSGSASLSLRDMGLAPELWVWTKTYSWPGCGEVMMFCSAAWVMKSTADSTNLEN